jgi:hypothetical protein
MYLTALPNVIDIFNEIINNLSGSQIRLMSFVTVLVVLIHGLLILFVMACFNSFHNRYGDLRRKGLDTLVYFTVVLLILFSHLIDIFVWTYAMVGVNVFPGVIKTFYFAGEMYTNLDHNDPLYKLGSEWRMLPILISFSGLFAVAISGAALYSLLISTFTATSKK